jgi:NAD(P)-dependent dehydrogenase (short-subunit alcohol dehydrogenase family)
MKPGGIAGRGGSIVNMSSTAGMVSYYAASAYCASKGAVTMLTKVAAVECGKNNYGIRVNSVHPGVIHTPLLDAGLAEQAQKGLVPSAQEATAMYTSLHPIGRLGKPIDVALAVLYLASSASDFCTGSELVVDGGFTAQ